MKCRLVADFGTAKALTGSEEMESKGVKLLRKITAFAKQKHPIFFERLLSFLSEMPVNAGLLKKSPISFDFEALGFRKPASNIYTTKTY